MKFIALVLLLTSTVMFAQHSSPDNIKVIENMPSEYVSARDVYIRLPVDYDENQSYPVLYMHDGQMLFSHLKTWNGQSWAVDKTVRRLVDSSAMTDIIVVGVANVKAERHANYFPEKPFLSLAQSVKDSLLTLERGDSPLFSIPVNSDDYLKFLVFELKPYVDQHYSTKKDSAHTFIAGSSMGGLISMYAFFEYPEIYGGAACISTHWIGSFSDNNAIPKAFESYIDNRKALLKGRKLYFDHGTKTLDRFYGTHQQHIDAIF